MISPPDNPGGPFLVSRRGLFSRAAGGLAAIALGELAAGQRGGVGGVAGSGGPIRPRIDPNNPSAPRGPHFAPKAKRVVLLYCAGACSQVDTFDYKPELIRRHGQPLPGAGDLITFQGEQGALTRSPYRFRPRGSCGKPVSDLLPHLGDLVDEMCFIHSMTTRTNTHGPGENMMSTGFNVDGFPSMGAWVSYALGSDNRDLPSFVAIPDPRGVPQSSVNNWGNGFLPAAFQGTPFSASSPIRHVSRPASVSESADLAARRFLQRQNARHLERFPGDTELSGRIASYELAARMQLSVPEISDLSRESAATLRSYGADHPDPVRSGFARNCILGRRLLEQGVRFVEIFNGSYAMGEGVGNWDGHKMLKEQYDVHGPVLDRPAAALLADLKTRGLLEDTLFVWTTEFGRMPTFQKGASGRDHNPDGFTAWLAGAGVKAPFSFGATDEFGHRAVEDVVTTYDLHATILHLLGLDHTRLSYYHNGIERRLTDVHGEVITPILA